MEEQDNTVTVRVLTMRSDKQPRSSTFKYADIAKLLAQDWHEHRDDWKGLETSWRPKDKVYLRLLGVESNTLTLGHTGQPTIQLNAFKDRLFAIRFGHPEAASSLRWEFVYRANNEAGLVNVEYLDYAIVDYPTGKIQMSGFDGVLFSPNDGIWPWPIVFPEKFQAWSGLRAILAKDDANPLTGLLANKKDAPARTLAEQLARRLTRACDEWAQEIIATL